MPSPATLRVQTADQGWETLGVDRYRGVVPEGIKASANVWGPDLLGCTLKRKPGAIFPDLATWTPCELEIGGMVVWDGALKEAPEQDGDDFQVGVVGAGWQYHLDDDTNDKVWVHTRLPDYQDLRSFLTAELGLGRAYAGGQVSNQGSIVISMPNAVPVGAGGYVGVCVDLGPGNTWKRAILQYETSNNSGSAVVYIRGHSAPDSVAWPANDAIAGTAITTLGASGTTGGTIGTASRYCLVFIYMGAAQTPGADIWVKIKSLQLFNSTAYESGNASILKTSDLVKDVLPWAPLLSQDTGQIAASTFSWPEAAPFDEKTPREIIESFNAAERRRARILVGRILQYGDFPTTPLFEIGEWPGSEFKDTSANSGQEVYNKVKVKGTGPDGAKLTITRTQSGTILDRAPGGTRTRTKVLPVSIGLTTALGNKLGDAFLSVHKTTPLKGSVTIAPGGARRIEGGTVDPAQLLLHTTELLRLSHRINPDTGDWGRDGQIAQVDYDHDAQTAVVSLDNARDNFEALLNRLGALVGSS
jgi:hypothetical protein